MAEDQEDRLPADWITPGWPAPPWVRSLMTTRNGGHSHGPWGGAGGGMNVGLGSGDDPDVVRRNRALLERRLPCAPAWLNQVHGTHVVDAASVDSKEPVDADAAYATAPGRVCAIVVADCLPVLLTDRRGSRVAAAHAGWRGLAAGVLEATIDASGLDPDETLAWLGPSIGPSRFEVGADVREAFIAVAAPTDADAVAAAFSEHRRGKWMADLPELARIRLAGCGVVDVRASGLCTATHPERFYSYRRDRTTGRMAVLIWIDHRLSS